VVFGRSPEATVTIDDARVSREHARFERTKGELWLEDLGSRNGTRVGGDVVRSARRRLASGDVVLVGDAEIVVAVAAGSIAGGRLAGPKKPNQRSKSRVGWPSSASVGMSGANGERLLPAFAKMRNLPAWTWGSAELIGTSVKVSDQQFPRVWEAAKKAAETLRVRLPAVYVAPAAQNIKVRALGTADDAVYLVLGAQIADALTDGELVAVLGHEMGHIQNSHVLYATALHYLNHGAIFT